MTTTSVFATTLQKSNIWLNELTERLHLRSEQEAYQALRATLHALRDRLQPEAAAHLGAQLPMLIRGMYYEGWKPSAAPKTVRDRQEFLAMVRDKAGDVQIVQDTERVVTGVFDVLDRHVTPGEMAKVRTTLPDDIATLLPQ